MNKKKLIWLIPVGIAAVTLFVFLGGEVVQHLWNWLLPPLFGFKEVTFWQALGILALSRILFGGFGGSSNSSRSKDRKKNMTPEERERFREKMRKRCGFDAEEDSGEAGGTPEGATS
jgi:hypothetical protein